MAFHFPHLNRGQSCDSVLALVSVKACGDTVGSMSQQKIAGVCKKEKNRQADVVTSEFGFSKKYKC